MSVLVSAPQGNAASICAQREARAFADCILLPLMCLRMHGACSRSMIVDLAPGLLKLGMYLSVAHLASSQIIYKI